MSNTYHRPAPTGDGLRLHLNENTAGCSPKVLEALARLSATDVAFYPDYDAVYREAAVYLGVPEDRLLLVNGLDEGILMSHHRRAAAASGRRLERRSSSSSTPRSTCTRSPRARAAARW